MKPFPATASAVTWFSHIAVPGPQQDTSEISTTAVATESTASTQTVITKSCHDMTLSTTHRNSTPTGYASRPPRPLCRKLWPGTHIEASTFPFDRLPQELKLMIVRFAMPQHGLRPMSKHSSSESGRFHDRDIIGYAWYKKHQREHSPAPLFCTSKWFSSTALPLFHQEVPYYINIYPWGIRHHNESLLFARPERCCPEGHRSYHFRSHRKFQQLPSFKSMQNYRLNAILGKNWYDDYWIANEEKRERYYSRSCSSIKEQLRLVCDSLASNDQIQSLSVTVPCYCCLKGGHRAEEALSWTLDFLAPLKRLRVAKAVVVRAVYDDGFDGSRGDVWLNHCERPECKQLGKDVQVALGHLAGEPLRDEEIMWRELKATDIEILDLRSWDTLAHYHHFWARLNYSQLFSERAESIDKGALEILGDIALLIVRSLRNDYYNKLEEEIRKLKRRLGDYVCIQQDVLE
ncbi:MAG: hypothetical protein Q9186_003518 [Xanthomendoza sp. 1 TL-2023]